MRSWGSFLLIYGLIAAVLKLLHTGVGLLILFWVDTWGVEVGWAIRIGMIVVGAGLLLASMKTPRPPQSRQP